MLPNGWKRQTLDRCADIQTGVAKGKTNIKDPVFLPYLRVANVQDGYLDLSDIKEIEIERSQIGRFRLQVGDVLLTRMFHKPSRESGQGARGTANVGI